MKKLEETDKSLNLELENFFPFIITTLTRQFHSLMESEFRTLNISIAEWRVLVCLSRNEKCTLNDIVEFTTLPQSSLSRVMVKMEKKNFVTTNKLESDNRYLDLRITNFGLDTVSQANITVLAAVEQKLSLLKENERNTLLYLLKRFVTIMNST